MKRFIKLTLAILSLIILIGCNEKVVYIKPICPYVEPLDLNITTNDKGGLSSKETSKVFNALRYYKKETIRLKTKVRDEK